MRRLLAPVAIAAALAIPATAHANAYTADADCSGFVLSIPRTEDGTQVLVTRNGQTVTDVRNDVFGAPVRVSIPSPDQTVRQTWRATITGYNGTYRWAETVEPCVAPTTVATTVPTTVATTSTTVPPVVVTTTVDVPPPPVPSSTTTTTTTPVTPPPVTTPRAPSTTGPTWTLPETGASGQLVPIAFATLAAGCTLLVARRRGGAS